MSIQIPVHIRRAVQVTWQAIGPDWQDGAVMEEGVDEPLLCQAEACIDANRLVTYGGLDGRQAEEDVTALIAEHGYDAVLRALADKCY